MWLLENFNLHMWLTLYFYLNSTGPDQQNVVNDDCQSHEHPVWEGPMWNCMVHRQLWSGLLQEARGRAARTDGDGRLSCSLPPFPRGVQEGRPFQAKDTLHKGGATDQKADMMPNEARSPSHLPSHLPSATIPVPYCPGQAGPSSHSGSQACSSASPFQGSVLICDLVLHRQVCLLLPQSPGGCFSLHYQTLWQEMRPPY